MDTHPIIGSKLLGERIRSLRKAHGLTVRDLIEQYDFHLTAIHAVEKGRAVSAESVERLAAVFNVEVKDLLTDLD